MFKTHAILGFTFLIAIFLTLMPMSSAFAWFRPCWIVLVLSFWIIHRSQSIGIWWGFWVGLVMDIMMGSVLGEHAFALICVAYLLERFQRRLRPAHFWQQGLFVASMVLLYQLIIFIIQGLDGLLISDWRYWTPVVTTFLVWPYLYYLVHRFQRRYHLYSLP